MLDYTAQNVYKGNAAMMNYYSAIDRGNEEVNDGVNLKFPSGSARDWGNRDYDVNLVLADKAFDQSGQLYFNPLITDGYPRRRHDRELGLQALHGRACPQIPFPHPQRQRVTLYEDRGGIP